MYVTGVCPFCHRAESLLRSKGIGEGDLDIVRVDRFPERRQEMMERSGRRTVPQIWIGERHVGGCDDLHALEAAGQLDPLLAA
jgi:glutaredoxin 3